MSDKQLSRALNALKDVPDLLMTQSEQQIAVRRMYVALDEILRYLLERDGEDE